MDELLTLMLIKAVHVVAASIWIGSIISLSLAVRVVRRFVGSPASIAISSEMGRRLRPLTRTSLYLAIVSGALLAIQRGFLSALLAFAFEYRPVVLVLLKVMLGTAVLILVEYHSSLGASIARIANANGARALRRRIVIVGWATVALSIAMAVLGTALRFG